MNSKIRTRSDAAERRKNQTMAKNQKREVAGSTRLASHKRTTAEAQRDLVVAVMAVSRKRKIVIAK